MSRSCWSTSVGVLLLAAAVTACARPQPEATDDPDPDTQADTDTDEDTDEWDPDIDQDGFSAGEGDCDDQDPRRHPGADEVCDRVDNDCDALVDEEDADLTGGVLLHADGDRDGFGDPTATTMVCADRAGLVDDDSDCDDSLAEVHPGAEEICGDGVKNDCDADLADIWEQCADLWLTEDVPAVYGKEDSFLGLRSLRRLEDFDGDGVPDLIATGSTSAWVIAGGRAFSTPEVERVATLDITGTRPWIVVASAGDQDGDGRTDVLFAQPFEDSAEAEGVGAVYLFTGSTVGSRGLDEASAVIRGGVENTRFGFVLDGGRDLDGDGKHDFVAGSSEALSRAGAVYVFTHTPTGEVDHNAADAVVIGEADERLGEAVSIDGDVNGDGRADLLVGATSLNRSSTHPATAYLFQGTLPVYARAVDTADVRLISPELGDRGANVLDFVGDFNGDGLDDIVFGASWSTDYAGCGYIAYGGVRRTFDLGSAPVTVCGGEARAYVAKAAGPAGDIDGDGLDDVWIHSNVPGGARLLLGGTEGTFDIGDLTHRIVDLGVRLEAIGDLDGDGYDDIAAAVPTDDTRGPNGGALYLLPGGRL